MGYSFFLSRIFDVEVRSEIGSGEVVEKVQALPRSIHLHSGSDAPLNVTFIRAPPGTLLKVDIPLVFIRDDVSPGLKKVIGIKDPIRPGVREAVQTCQAVEITVRMVTGDNISTAKVIAKECGIFTEGGLAIEGSQFRDLPLHEMRAMIPKILVMARSLPLDKHTLVSNLRKIGEVVAVTGDGTKDAPALHEADIGLAMGIAGTEVAKENADVIIMDDNFKTIVNVARWGRAVYINIQKFVQFQLTVNVVALIINFVSACITENPDLQGKSGLLGFPPQSYLSEIDGANFGSHRC